MSKEVTEIKLEEEAVTLPDPQEGQNSEEFYNSLSAEQKAVIKAEYQKIKRRLKPYSKGQLIDIIINQASHIHNLEMYKAYAQNELNPQEKENE